MVQRAPASGQGSAAVAVLVSALSASIACVCSVIERRHKSRPQPKQDTTLDCLSTKRKKSIDPFDLSHCKPRLFGEGKSLVDEDGPFERETFTLFNVSRKVSRPSTLSDGRGIYRLCSRKAKPIPESGEGRQKCESQNSENLPLFPQLHKEKRAAVE